MVPSVILSIISTVFCICVFVHPAFCFLSQPRDSSCHFACWEALDTWWASLLHTGHGTICLAPPWLHGGDDTCQFSQTCLEKIHGRQTLSSLCNSVMFSYVFHSPVTFFWATYMSFQATKKFPPLQYIISNIWSSQLTFNMLQKLKISRRQGPRSSPQKHFFHRPKGRNFCGLEVSISEAGWVV